MPDYVTLLGAEQVKNAAHEMHTAAEQMISAALTVHAALDRNQRFLDDWLCRLACILEKRLVAGEDGNG